jgi:hypothetical protein
MIDKKLQRDWEKKLEKRGLGIYQPVVTDNSRGETVITTGGETDIHKQLRKGIDGGDQFMDAFQIAKIRTIDRELPEWAMNNKRVQEVLLVAFPTLKRTKASRKKAARWASVIYLYYRMGLPQQVVMKELKLTKPAFKTICQRVEAIIKNGVSRDSKQNATPPTPREGLGEKGDETK